MTSTAYNTKIGKYENKISGLVSITVPSTKIGEEIPDFSGLVKKIDCNTKSKYDKSKYVVYSGYGIAFDGASSWSFDHDFLLGML